MREFTRRPTTTLKELQTSEVEAGEREAVHTTAVACRVPNTAVSQEGTWETLKPAGTHNRGHTAPSPHEAWWWHHHAVSGHLVFTLF